MVKGLHRLRVRIMVRVRVVFVKDSVKHSLQEINHKRGARVLSAGGARGFAKQFVLHHEGAHTQIKS